MKNYIAAFICIVIGGGLFALMGPAIIRDWMVDADTLVRASDYAVKEASCETTAWILNSCDFVFEHRPSAETLRFDYMLFGRVGGADVYAMQTPDGSHVTTNIGIEYVKSRLSTLFVFGGFMLSGGLFLLFGQPKNSQSKKQL